MIKQTEAVARKNTFILCRYVLILATGTLAFIELARDASPLPVAAMMVVVIASNVVLSNAPPFSFFDPALQAPVLVSDTAMIATILLLTRASQEFFLFFFFVLIMAAKVESLTLLGLCAGSIGLASFLLSDPSTGWASPTLMRVPFLFATGVFFGYVVLPERMGETARLRPPLALSYIRPPQVRMVAR